MSVQEDSQTALCLHDAVVVGQVEEGFSISAADRSESVRQRLPILVRLLSSSRPLLSKKKNDPLRSLAVSRLEDATAVDRFSEGTEVVSCYLAPAVCHKVSQLERNKPTDLIKAKEITAVETREGYFPSPTKKRKISSQGFVALDDGEAKEGGTTLVEGEQKGIGLSQKRSLSTSHTISIVPEEESLEGSLSRILSDLASLVVFSSLADDCSPTNKNPEEGEVDSSKSTSDANSAIPSGLEDSLLAETHSSTLVVGNELGSSIVSLLHFSPVLRLDHVAVR